MSLPALQLRPQPQPLPVLLIEDEPAVMAYVQAALERSARLPFKQIRLMLFAFAYCIHPSLTQHNGSVTAPCK